MNKLWILVIFPILACAESISEKKAALAQKNVSRDTDISFLNNRLTTLRKGLEEAYVKAGALTHDGANEEAFRAILNDVNRLKKEKEQLEQSWRETAVQEGLQDGESYSLWDQEEVTLSQLVMEYGSPDYLYVIPPEFAAMKLNLYSNIPIPRQSWSDLLEVMLHHNGFGMKKINTYARQLYLLKLDLGAVKTIAYRPEQVAIVPRNFRIISKPLSISLATKLPSLL